MAVKKLTQVGNSLGFIVEKPILDLINAGRETEWNFNIEDGKLVFSPIGKGEHKAKVKNAAKKVMANHINSLKKLAK